MTASIDSINKWLVDNGLAAEGSQQAADLSFSLLGHLRAESRGTLGDTRNVQDRFKNLPNEDIQAAYADQRSGLINVFVNLIGDFNLSTGVRNTNWYGGHGVWIAGRRRWDKRGSVGAHHYIEVEHKPDVIEAIHELHAMGYRVVGAEINDDAVSLTDYQWQDKSAVIYGEEGAGLSAEVLALVDDVVFIPGRGTVRSLNVGVTSGIFTHDYTVKRGLI